MVETFFKSIKAELIWRNRWDTRRQAEGAIFQYIIPLLLQNPKVLVGYDAEVV